MSPEDTLEVTVVCSPEAGGLEQLRLTLPAGSTVADALAASGLLQRHPGLAGLPVGIWGRKEEPTVLLRDRDRVEIYRPLLCDPKEARRLRYRQKAGKDVERKQRKQLEQRKAAAAGAGADAALSGNPKP